MRKQLAFIFFMVGAASMLVMSLHYLQNEVSGILQNKPLAEFGWFRGMFKLHIASGIIAITSGPFQFLPRFRAKYPLIHRRIGYVYMFAVLLSSLAGLVIAQGAMGGLMSTLGFSLLAVLWLATLIQAFLTAKRREFPLHRNWMHLNYAITFAAITQRTMLLFAMIPGIPFMPIYKWSSWLPWMINLGIAWYVLHRSNPQTLKVSQ